MPRASPTYTWSSASFRASSTISIQFYWDVISQGTLAEGAQLHFERVPAELVCLDCSTRFRMSDTSFDCPECGGSKVKVVAGDEFRLEAIDIETEGAELPIQAEEST